MKDNFVSYDLAIGMASIGFDEPSYACYSEVNGGEINLMISPDEKILYSKHYILAPTKIQAKEWFEKHNIELDDELK